MIGLIINPAFPGAINNLKAHATDDKLFFLNTKLTESYECVLKSLIRFEHISYLYNQCIGCFDVSSK